MLAPCRSPSAASVLRDAKWFPANGRCSWESGRPNQPVPSDGDQGPHSLDDQRLRRLADRIFSGYHAPPITAPIELVRDLEFGAAEYAQRLGFAPHPDFDRARDHLGPWSGPSAITFGCNGKPTYISGPHDNPDRVLRALRRVVGRDGFNYTVGIDLTELPLTG